MNPAISRHFWVPFLLWQGSEDGVLTTLDQPYQLEEISWNRNGWPNQIRLCKHYEPCNFTRFLGPFFCFGNEVKMECERHRILLSQLMNHKVNECSRFISPFGSLVASIRLWTFFNGGIKITMKVRFWYCLDFIIIS